MKSLTLRLTLVFILIFMLISGCAPAAPEVPVLRVEWTQWEGDYTLVVAQELGYFEKYGVKVEPIYYEVFDKAVPDIAAGKIDAGLFAIDNLLAASRLTDLKGIAVYDSGGTSTIVAASSVKSAANLAGQRVGVTLGTFGELFIKEFLEANGLTTRDVTLVDIPPEDIPRKIPGEIIAGYTWEPYTSEAVNKGFQILYSSQETGTASLYPDVIVIRSQWANENPELVKAFMNAWFDAVEYRKNNVEQSKEIIAKYTGLALDEIVLGNVTLYNREENLSLFNMYPGRDPSSIYFTARANLDFLINNGNITRAPDLLEILDPSYLK